MRVPVRLLLVLAWIATPLGCVHASGSAGGLLPRSESVREVFRLAQSYNCTPRRYCSKNIRSCEEAIWYLENCSWGGALDRDNYGVPCENFC